MKRLIPALATLALLALFTVAAVRGEHRRQARAVPRPASPRRSTTIPIFRGVLGGAVDKEAYLQARGDYFMLRFDNASVDQILAGRLQGLQQMKSQAGQQGPFAAFGIWTPLGPYPIPNGQTTNVATAVSGRVTAIAVHPTNPDLVYVGTAQGGVWRSMDGGASWTRSSTAPPRWPSARWPWHPRTRRSCTSGPASPTSRAIASLAWGFIASTTRTRARC